MIESPPGGKRLGVIMDAIDLIKPYKDTTFALLLEAQRRGWSIHYMELADLTLDGGQVVARMRSLEVFEPTPGGPATWYRASEPSSHLLTDLDAVLMRKDPPVDMHYIYATQLLELAEAHGVAVYNRPGALRAVNEKLFISHFADCIAPTQVSADLVQLEAFVRREGIAVGKPLDAMGGSGVFRLAADDVNVKVILEMLTEMGTKPIMVQRFIPAIRDGDKRVLLIDGEPVEYALARVPPDGQIRANLAVGGRGEARPLSTAEQRIARRVGPRLRELGLAFVGLDVIGDYLTEINVTSPTGIREIEAQCNINVCARLFEYIEGRLSRPDEATA